MIIKKDDIDRIHLIDDLNPSGSIVFDIYSDRVAVYQDSEDQKTRTAFETIGESAEFNRHDLAKGLEEIAEMLRSDI